MTENIQNPNRHCGLASTVFAEWLAKVNSLALFPLKAHTKLSRAQPETHQRAGK